MVVDVIPFLFDDWKNLIRFNDIVDYISARQNEDGGYTFARGAESSAQDTYYAVEVLGMLGVEPKNTDKTVLFLERLQHEDGNFDSVKVAYYVIKALFRLGYRLAKPVKKLEGLKNPDTYVEVASEIENVYLAVELLKAFNFSINSDRVIKQILRLKNRDGSFGSRRRSRLASTYYALRTLKMLDYDVERLRTTLDWTRRCEVPTWGFVASPEQSPTFIVIEDIYFGVKSLETLNEKCRYPHENLELIAKFQNLNGGFRRTISLGVSDFESTYQAVSTMETVLKSLSQGAGIGRYS